MYLATFPLQDFPSSLHRILLPENAACLALAALEGSVSSFLLFSLVLDVDAVVGE